MSGYWSIILPQATTNLVTNPSFELGVSGWSAADGAGNTTTPTRATTYQKYGAYSAELAFNAGGANPSYYIWGNATVTAGTSYTFSMDVIVPGTIGTGTYLLRIDWYNGASYLSASQQASQNTTGYWVRQTLTAAAPATATVCQVMLQFGGGASTSDFTMYLDGAQFEAQSAASTYCDGDQPDCKWSAAKHASTSTRSARTRAGGQIVNLDSLGLYIEEITGIGHPDAAHRVRMQPQRDGGKLLGHTVLPRSFELAGIVPGSSRANLHTLRKALINAIKTDAVLDSTQPCLLRYAGSNSTKDAEIYANYDTGFGYAGIEGYTERMGVRWIAYDPYFYETGEVSAALTTSSAITDANYIIAKIDGAWQAMGTGMDGTVWSIANGPDGSIYAAGGFTTSGGVTTNRLAKWDGSAWSMVGTTTGFDAGDVLALAVDAAGGVYAGGSFHNVDGTLVNHAAYWNGSAWSMVGATTGLDDVVRAIVIGEDGSVYMGGDFHNGDGTLLNHCGKWNGTAWSMVGVTTGMDDIVHSLAIGPRDGDLYIGGAFLNGDGTVLNKLAKWDGTSITALSTGCGTSTITEVYDLSFAPSGKLYAVGNFNVVQGDLYNYFIEWNGSSWKGYTARSGQLSIDGPLYSSYFDDSDGLLYVSGAVLSTTPFQSNFYIWNGTTFNTPDIILPGSPPYVYAFLKYQDNFYLGMGTSGTATTSYSGTITNNGTHLAYPVIKIKRSGGTSATLSWIKNETTKKTLWFNYALLDGEEITIDLRPGSRNITSSFWGNAWRALQRGSDFSDFTLLPGANIVTTVITEVGSPTVTAYATWRNAHWSADGTAA